MAQLNLLKRTSARSKKRVGRGQSSGRGKTSGRGTKGQNARAGRKKRPELRDMIKKIPKRRGYGKNRGRTVVGNRARPEVISLTRIAQAFDAGTSVTREALVTHKLISSKTARIKVVGGALTKKLVLVGVPVSAGVRAAIEKEGGNVS